MKNIVTNILNKYVHIVNSFIVIWEVDPNDSREGYKGITPLKIKIKKLRNKKS